MKKHTCTFCLRAFEVGETTVAYSQAVPPGAPDNWHDIFREAYGEPDADGHYNFPCCPACIRRTQVREQHEFMARDVMTLAACGSVAAYERGDRRYITTAVMYREVKRKATRLKKEGRFFQRLKAHPDAFEDPEEEVK
jgi:hypothetical protein